MATINITGTGGIIEGNLGTSNVNVNLEPALQFGLDASGDIGAVHKITQTGFTHHNRDISFSCWFRAAAPWTTSPSKTALFSMVNGTNTYRTLWVGIEGNDDNPRFRGYIGDGSSYDGFENVIITDEEVEKWNHYAITISSGNTNTYTVKTYINGVLKANDTTHSQNYDSTARAPQVGDDGYANLDGLIKDWRCYGTELDINDIKILASKMNVSNALLADSAELQLHYKLDGTDISSTTVTNAGNASSSNGTLNTTTGIVTHYDEFSVNVQDNSTTTDGTFTVTQGKVEGKALTSLEYNIDNDFVVCGDGTTDDVVFGNNNFTMSAWVQLNSSVGSGSYNYIMAIGNNASGKQAGFGFYDTTERLFVSAYSSPIVYTDYVLPALDKWHHIAISYEGGSTDVVSFYVNGVLVETESIALDVEVGKIYIGANVGESSGLDGLIRDARIYDFALSADQMASLYSNTFNITPLHRWKLDDAIVGTSTPTAVDSGTGTTANGTLTNFSDLTSTYSGSGWKNGTLDLDGTLTIAANGTMSCPRGNLDLAVNLEINCTTVADQWIHNSGKVRWVSSGTHIQLDTGGATFNNVDLVKSSGHDVKLREDMTILGTLDLTGSNDYWIMDANGAGHDVTLTMGSSTASGTIESAYDSRFRLNQHSSGKCIIQGASSLYPCNVTSNDWYWDYGSGAAGTELANIDFQTDLETHKGGSNTAKITLTGDCEFDAVTVSSGDTLDVNGKRMECSGTLTVSGNADYGGGLLLANRFDIGGVNTNEEGTDFIANSSGSPVHAFSSSSFVGDANTNFLFNGTADVNANHSGFLGNMYIANGKIDAKGHHYGTNFTVATGATYDTEAKNINILGDLTVSGGLIGKSCAVFNSDDGTSNGNFITAGSGNNSDSWTNMSVEAWIKLDHLGRQGSESTIFSRGSNAVPKFGIYSGKLRMYGGSSSKAIGGTGSNGDISIQETLVTGKWYHVACSYNNSSGAAKLYVNGRLDCEATIDTGMLVADVGASCIGAQSTGNRHFDGTMGKISIWDHELTEDEIRELMFYTGAEMQAATNFSSIKNDCKFFYNFDEASGDTIVDSGPGGNNADWDLKGSHTGLTTGMTSSGALWATTGLMLVADDSSNHGESGTTPNTSSLSTLIFSKNGTQQFNFLHNDIIGNIQVDANSTTELYCHDDGGGTIQVYGNFVINGILKPEATSGTSSNTNIRMRTGDKTITIGNATTGVASLYRMTLSHPSGTLTLPYSYHKRIICDQNGTTVQGSTLRVTEELEVQNGHTYNSSAANLEFKVMDFHNGSTVDLSGSFINQKPAHTDGAISFGASANITMTNKSGRGVAILGNDTGGTNTDVNMPAAGDWFMEGGGQEGKPAIQDCRMLSGSDLTVIGSTLGLTFEDNTANVHQFTQNIDTNHLLDSDPTDDDDVSLPRPTLDNSLQLTGGD